MLPIYIVGFEKNSYFSLRPLAKFGYVLLWRIIANPPTSQDWKKKPLHSIWVAKFVLYPHNQGKKRRIPPTKKKGFSGQFCDKCFWRISQKNKEKLVKSLENHISQKFPKKLSEKWQNLSKTNHCLQWNEKKKYLMLSLLANPSFW